MLSSWPSLLDYPQNEHCSWEMLLVSRAQVFSGMPEREWELPQDRCIEQWGRLGDLWAVWCVYVCACVSVCVLAIVHTSIQEQRGCLCSSGTLGEYSRMGSIIQNKDHPPSMFKRSTLCSEHSSLPSNLPSLALWGVPCPYFSLG